MNLTNPINATIANAQGLGTIIDNDLPASPTFAIRTEGTISINSNSNFDSNPLDINDDAKIYAGKGFTFNGNLTLPVQRNSNGSPLYNSSGKLLLVDKAVTVANGYQVSNANGNANQYGNLLPPQVIPQQTVVLPVYTDTVSLELSRLIPTGTPTVTFNVQQNPLNNAQDWTTKFPSPGTTSIPKVVRVINGGLNIPSNVTLSNTVIIVDSGDINSLGARSLDGETPSGSHRFNGSGHNFNNVALIANNGNINLASVQSTNLSVLASGSINTNSGARFGGSTLLANGNSNSSITFNGATTTTNSSSSLRVISAGDITYNANSNTKGTFTAGKNFTFNGNSTLIGVIETKGNIIFNGQATIIAPLLS